MILYFLIGCIYSMLMLIGNNYYVKIENDETKRFTYIELLMMVIIWPIYFILTIIHYTKDKKL